MSHCASEVIKTTAGFILAAAVVAYLYLSSFEMKLVLTPLPLFIPMFIVICLLIPVTALPIYLFITYKLGYSYKTVVLSAVVSIVITSVWLVFPSGIDKSVVGQKVLVEDGKITLLGYQYAFTKLFFISIVGALGGSVFYIVKSIRLQS